MKPALRKLMVALSVIAALAMVMVAEQPQAVLGKINFARLFDAAPAMPASPAEAGRHVFGTDLDANTAVDLSPFYQPYTDQLDAAHNVLMPALESRTANQEALGKRAVADANSSAIIAGMGGVDKMSEMSEEEVQEAAIKAAGNYQQRMSGAPPNAQGGGMQAMMQRLMSDPEYQARFDKMSKKEQEAELQKYMGNARAPAPPSGPTAAERQAQQAVNETGAVLARQNEINAIFQQIVNVETEFVEKDKAVGVGPGNHEEIRKQTVAKIEKIPLVDAGELGAIHDPIKVRVVMREQATLDRNRAGLELQKRIALYTQRRTRYKELAGAYTAWLRRSTAVSSSTAQLLNDATADVALSCEQELVNLGNHLRKYHEDATRDAAMYEMTYQKRMTRDETY